MSQLIEVDTDDHVVRERLLNGGPCPFKGDNKAFMKRLQIETWAGLRRFFENKKFHAGGPIPKSHLFTTQNFNRVVSTPFNEGISLCYELFDKCQIPPPVGFDHEAVEWDVYYVLNLLGEVQRCRIQPYLQAGVMVLYFKICHGVRVPDIDLDITHLVT